MKELNDCRIMLPIIIEASVAKVVKAISTKDQILRYGMQVQVSTEIPLFSIFHASF